MRPLSELIRDSDDPFCVHRFPELLQPPAPRAALGRHLRRISRHHRARQSGGHGPHQPSIHLGHAALARPRGPGRRAARALAARELFKRELFGIDEPLSRVVDYFKAAAAGSDVGRRLLLLLGPPSGGKSTLAILMKRGLEEYSRTDEGAMYAIKGSPLRENPLNLVPAEPARGVPRALWR